MIGKGVAGEGHGFEASGTRRLAAGRSNAAAHGQHTGQPWRAVQGYVEMDVPRAARIANIGHGGQVRLSETTAALVQGELHDRRILDLPL